MTAEHIDISAVVRSPEQEFADWRAEQDFDYQRIESAVIDYVNQHIDYDELDAAVRDGADIGGLDTACEELGFYPDSSEAVAVKQHFRAYVTKQRKINE